MIAAAYELKVGEVRVYFQTLLDKTVLLLLLSEQVIARYDADEQLGAEAPAAVEKLPAFQIPAQRLLKPLARIAFIAHVAQHERIIRFLIQLLSDESEVTFALVF